MVSAYWGRADGGSHTDGQVQQRWRCGSGAEHAFLVCGARRMAASVDGAGPEGKLWMVGTGWDRRPRGWTREDASAAVASVEARRLRKWARGTPRPSASQVCCAVPWASELVWWYK